MALIFLDSNIFLYAAGSEHPEKAPCRKLLELAAGGKLEAVTSSEVLREVLYVRLRRGSRAEALEVTRNIRDMMDEILPVTGDDVLAACDLLGKHSGLDARDAVHAAVALRNRIFTIASVDRDFDALPGLRRLTPAQAAA
jgi:predicted nucleic acid-binding protein